MYYRYSSWVETQSISMIFFFLHSLPLSAKIFLPRITDLTLCHTGGKETAASLQNIRISEWPDSPHLLLPIPSVTMRQASTFFRSLHLSSCSYSLYLQGWNLRAGKKLNITEPLLTPVVHSRNLS